MPLSIPLPSEKNGGKENAERHWRRRTVNLFPVSIQILNGGKENAERHWRPLLSTTPIATLLPNGGKENAERHWRLIVSKMSGIKSNPLTGGRKTPKGIGDGIPDHFDLARTAPNGGRKTPKGIGDLSLNESSNPLILKRGKGKRRKALETTIAYSIVIVYQCYNGGKENAERHWRPSVDRLYRALIRPTTGGRKTPKGIGDPTEDTASLSCQTRNGGKENAERHWRRCPWPCVLLFRLARNGGKENAERHWRCSSARQCLKPMVCERGKENAERHWRLGGGGFVLANAVFNNGGKENAERHWRQVSLRRGEVGEWQTGGRKTPKGIGDHMVWDKFRPGATKRGKENAERHWRHAPANTDSRGMATTGGRKTPKGIGDNTRGQTDDAPPPLKRGEGKRRKALETGSGTTR